MDGTVKRIFLVWKRACTRSENQARHFSAKLVYVWPFDSQGSKLRLMTRYVVSFIQTLRILHRERADVVFTLNQPPFLLLAVSLYTRLLGGSYVLDSHSAAFNDPKWAWFRPMYRRIARRALLNINTNAVHKRLVEEWGGRSFIISDVPIDHDRAPQRVTVPKASVLVVVSYMFDEPLESIWKAAALTPQVSYLVTGDDRKLPPVLKDITPKNLRTTGYLSKEAYFDLMASVSAVMVLTIRDQTMQMGAYEALSLGQPIITSDWQILRDSFGPAAAYVDNSPESIVRGVLDVTSNAERFRRAATEQKNARRRYFDATRSEIISVLVQSR
jgi:glycosyltransferase involved in cell wall biosynthesis